MSRSVFESTLSQHIVMSDIDALNAVTKFPSRYSYDPLPVGATDPITITPIGSPFTFANRTGIRAEAVITGGTMSAIAHQRQAANGPASTSVPAAAGTVLLSPGDQLTITYSVAPSVTVVPHA